MSNNLYSNLAWLPPPEDFSLRCDAIAKEPRPSGEALRSLASYALTFEQLDHLADVIRQLREGNGSSALGSLTPFRLGVLSNSTVDFLLPALVATAARHGINLEVVAGKYGQVVQEALSPNSDVNRSKPDAVLIALDYRGLPVRATPGDADAAQACVQAALAHLDHIREGLKRHAKATCIIQTAAAPPESLFGSLDRAVAGSLSRILDDVNRELALRTHASGDVMVDVARLAETVGLADWHSPRDWNLAKIPFADAFLPIYAEHVCRVIAALRGKSRRCLILDLDNTIWGGVVGDDGLEGIEIAEGDPTGEAFRSVQRMALDLRQRGVVLAVCSKNTEETALSVFRGHPEMLLHENDIAIFVANWQDKPSNIRLISRQLALGLDSLVFLDDNPAERAHVRRELPEVAVPELPDDPALYARTLSAAGYFESITFVAEDSNRADFYRSNTLRASLAGNTSDLESYLRSLNMEITFQPFDPTGRARISQLINKSNQFNLTTRRYTEAQIAQMEQDASYFTLQVRLSDCFGDNGMISVVICREKQQGEWEIDTWLMSCRVLGRGVEKMVLKALVEHATVRHIRKLIGSFIPTGRNGLVESHYPSLGFREVQKYEDQTVYELELDGVSIETAPMTVRQVGFEAVLHQGQ